MELKPCPFCNGTKIRLSVTKSTSSRMPIHHVCYYCATCRTYGPRILYKPEERIWINENNLPEIFKDQAAEFWNRRFSESDATITIDDIRAYGATHRDELLEEYNKRKTSN